MGISHNDYWEECIAQASDDCEATLTLEQIKSIASAVRGAHEVKHDYFNVHAMGGNANSAEEKHRAEIRAIEARHREEMANAHSVIKRAIGVYPDSSISINEFDEVYCENGEPRRVF